MAPPGKSRGLEDRRLHAQNMRESLGNPTDVAQPVEQRFRNFLRLIPANRTKTLGIGASTGGRYRSGHSQLLCGLPQPCEQYRRRASRPLLRFETRTSPGFRRMRRSLNVRIWWRGSRGYKERAGARAARRSPIVPADTRTTKDVATTHPSAVATGRDSRPASQSWSSNR